MNDWKEYSISDIDTWYENGYLNPNDEELAFSIELSEVKFEDDYLTSLE